jgi:hypothetical protein
MPKEMQIIDVTDKKSIKCDGCGLIIPVPPRTISIEKMKHMQEVKRFAEWEEQKVKVNMGIGNVRCLIICPQCEQGIICTDQFSFHYGNWEKKE